LGTCSSPESLHLIASIADEICSLYKDSAHSAPEVHGIVADNTSPTCHLDVANVIKQSFENYVDIYINNAAPRTMAGVGSLDPEHIQKFCRANIQTPALTVDELVKRKVFRKDSRIVFISSARGRKVNHKTYAYSSPTASPRLTITSPMYCVRESAGERPVRCWAEAFRGKDSDFEFMSGTIANPVMVGLTRTKAISRHGQEFLEKIVEEILPMQAIPRIADPEDVAYVVGLLCSQEAR
jgi:NAD(P)-dependent dehydrogenase (short-subunit alcohol dehydrogenase family)